VRIDEAGESQTFYAGRLHHLASGRCSGGKSTPSLASVSEEDLLSPFHSPLYIQIRTFPTSPKPIVVSWLDTFKVFILTTKIGGK
jgi:hypothetical protein